MRDAVAVDILASSSCGCHPCAQSQSLNRAFAETTDVSVATAARLIFPLTATAVARARVACGFFSFGIEDSFASAEVDGADSSEPSSKPKAATLSVGTGDSDWSTDEDCPAGYSL